MACFRAVVTGRVQGVYYRAFVEQQAQALGLSGRVRNIERSGGVEVEAEGDRRSLERLAEYLQRGPRAARVEGVEITWGPYRARFQGFVIIR